MLPKPGIDVRESKRAAMLKTVTQVFAVLCLIAYFALLAYKGNADISALAQEYQGMDFWLALGRHLIRNLGGG